MPALSETQNAFAAALLDAARPVPKGLTSHTGPRPLKRFNVYRNNVFASLIDLLAGRYRAVERLVGEAFFRAMARVYVEAEPPRSPVLLDYGQGFAAFVEGFEPVAELPYLADVARLEWAWNTAYHAADAEPLNADALAAVAPREVASATFRLHPALRLVPSPYPIVTLWSALSREGDIEAIELDTGGEDALIIRPHLDVEVRTLPVGAVTFIAALGRGAPLAAAAEAAQKAAPDFELETNLAGLIESGAICGVAVCD